MTIPPTERCQHPNATFSGEIWNQHEKGWCPDCKERVWRTYLTVPIEVPRRMRHGIITPNPTPGTAQAP